MKNIIKSVIALVLVLSMILPTVSYAVIDSQVPEWEDIELSDDEFNEILAKSANNEGITPYITGLITDSNLALDKSGSNLLVAGLTTCKASVIKCGFKQVIIQRRVSSGSWANYLTFEDIYADSYTYRLTKTVTVPSGYHYRAVCVHYAKKSVLSTQTLDSFSNVILMD